MRKTLSWIALLPVIRFVFHALLWLVPPVGFIAWRMRVSKRRHTEMLQATERQAFVANLGR